MAAQVNTPCPAIAARATEWAMLEALMAGTAAMRSRGEAYLPRWPNEERSSHEARLRTATLFPALRRTVSVMAGKPFSKPLTLDEGAPGPVREWADDVDLQGVNLHTFAAEMFAEALAYGLAGILVDAPRALAPSGAVVTEAEQKAAGVRPYFVRVRHAQILGFRIEPENGRARLCQLRLAECVSVPDGPFGERLAERVRVLSPGAWEVWEKAAPGSGAEAQWRLVEAGRSGLAEIPFVPLYGFRRGLMDGASPLLDLAYLNVKHWQSQSDQDTILHVARVPILTLIGGDAETVLTIGSGAAVQLPAGGDMKFVEHSGRAIAAGQASLEALEQQMIQAGAELLVKAPGQRSATESANDAEANKSDLQRLVEGFEDALDQALWLMAQYAGLRDGGRVSLFKDFGAATLSQASGQLVLAMQTAGLISRATAIEELKRRGELSADIAAADEVERVEIEGPALAVR